MAGGQEYGEEGVRAVLGREDLRRRKEKARRKRGRTKRARAMCVVILPSILKTKEKSAKSP